LADSWFGCLIRNEQSFLQRQQISRQSRHHFIFGDLYVSRFYGIIKTVKPDNGYAFFRADDGFDCFVHFKSFEQAGLSEPKLGSRYSFDVEDSPRGPRAINIGVA